MATTETFASDFAISLVIGEAVDDAIQLPVGIFTQLFIEQTLIDFEADLKDESIS